MLNRLQRWLEGDWFLALATWAFRTYARLVYGLRVEDEARVPQEDGLVVAINHRSGLDPPVVGVSVPREIHFMAKKELFARPAGRLLMRGLRAFPVDRDRNDVGAIKDAMRRLKAGKAVGIFAQGTRNQGEAEALDGAAYLAQRAGVPLLPAAVWREGRRFHVRFGEPMTVEGRSRSAVKAATREVMERVNALIPGSRAFAPEQLERADEANEHTPQESR